jgi:hypothetical protein
MPADHLNQSNREAKMRNTNWFATAAAGALILAGMRMVWTTSSTQVVAAPELNQIEPFQINAAPSPTQLEQQVPPGEPIDPDVATSMLPNFSPAPPSSVHH